MRKLKPEDVDEILKLRYVDKMTIREIAENFGVSPRRIQQILRDPRLSKPGRKKQEISPDISREILRAYSEGLGIPSIQKRLKEKGYNVSRYLIWRHLTEKGVIRSRPRKRTKGCSLSWALKECSEGYCSFLGVLYFPHGGECPYSRVVFGIGLYNGVPLRSSIFGFDRITLSSILIPLSGFVPKSSRAMIVKAPPWVPTRGENKLLRFLRKREVLWKWIPYCEDLKYIARRSVFESLCFDTGSLMRMLRSEFKKFAEVG